ncbi:MAG: carbohydrate ABC transporter permease [Chloroflexi bacterium]|nr:carbohydrate ABC transporter permease [Chloroflexota bacterium]
MTGRPAASPAAPLTRRRLRRGGFGTILVLGVASLAMLVPIVWMLASSLKPEAEIVGGRPAFIPDAATLANYGALFEQFSFVQLTLNSVLVAGGVIALSVGLGGLAAYGLSRHPFRGDRLVLAVFLLTRMVTPAALVVPLYLIMERLGLLNSVISIVVGITVLNLPFVVWVLKPFFDAIDRDVEEAAIVDGLGPVGVFWRITIPLAAPGLLTVILLSFIAGWTDLLFPMSFSTTVDAQPLTSGLLAMQTGYKVYWGSLMAGGVYLMLPTLALATLLQRYLIRGMRLGY